MRIRERKGDRGQGMGHWGQGTQTALRTSCCVLCDVSSDHMYPTRLSEDLVAFQAFLGVRFVIFLGHITAEIVLQTA